MSLPRPRVLIVDDTPENIHILMSFLKKTCDVLAANSGARALECARKDRPDLILLDVMMPGLSGYQVCEMLKSEETTASIPVIFVTGLNDVMDEEKGLRLGAVDYIGKPFHPGLVRARVKNQLELKRHRDFLELEIQQRTEALMQAQKSRERLEAELSVAGRIQESMLPARQLSDPQGLGLELSAYLQAAREVGGDLFDYFYAGNGNLCFTLGDVSDKGVPAALFMVQVRTLFRTLGPASTDPACLLELMNEQLCQDNSACMFVTIVCGVLSLETGHLVLSRAGHESPVLIEPLGEARALEFAGGPALGLCEDASFENFETRLEPGQSLLLYTDGVTEACNGSLGQFGEGRLFHVLAKCCELQPQKLTENIRRNLLEFVGDAEASDDVTLMALRTG